MQDQLAQSHQMAQPFVVGRTETGHSAEYSPSLASNFNNLFIGESGSGKTFTILNTLARVYQGTGATIHILDTKGDFTYDQFHKIGLGNIITPDCINDLSFCYTTGNASINPLQFSRYEQAGGVYMAKEEFNGLMKMFNPSFSSKMSGYMSQILEEVYREKGIFHSQPHTWSNEPPTLLDVLDFIKKITRSVKTNIDVAVFDDIDKLRKGIKRTLLKIDKANKENADFNDAALYEQIEKDKNTMKQRLCDMVDKIIADDFNYYSDWKVESLLSIKDTIDNAINSQLFTRDSVSRKLGRINRYDISALSETHQQIIMHITMKQVFQMGIAQTVANQSFNPKIPNHLVVCDEGKHAKQIASSDLSPLNRIATEGRGYGVGLYLGVQNTKQITYDVATNFSTRFITKSSEGTYNELKKFYGVRQVDLKKLKSRENCLFSSGGKYELIQQYR